MPPQVMQHCIDAATDKQMQEIGASMRAETLLEAGRAALRHDHHDRLGVQGRRRDHDVAGRSSPASFNSGYTMKMTSKREGGPAIPGMPAETKMTIEAKWTGACKADQKPGDIIMGNGMKMNVSDMQKGVPGGMKK